MTDLMARKSKRLPDLVRSRIQYRQRLIDQMQRAEVSRHQRDYIEALLSDVTDELEEIDTLITALQWRAATR